MAHQDVGGSEARGMEQRAQIVDQPAEGERRSGGIAPGQPGAIAPVDMSNA